jgi:hypothetical protein
LIIHATGCRIKPPQEDFGLRTGTMLLILLLLPALLLLLLLVVVVVVVVVVVAAAVGGVWKSGGKGVHT